MVLQAKRERLPLDHAEFIPLAKGLHAEHYEQAKDVYDKLGVNRVAVYAVQTPKLDTLIWRIEQVIDVHDPDGILVIGRQSPDDVAQLPDRVDEVAGYWNWKNACNLTAEGYSSEEFVKWFHKVKKARRDRRTDRQSRLNFSYSKEVRTDGGR